MKINRQFQDLHSREKSEVDWVAVQNVERDICLLYYQLADYCYIMGDLYYGDVYALPYWDYLNIEGLESPQQEFIRQGCLVMLFAMASEILDGGGCYLMIDKSRYVAAKEAVGALPRFDEDTNRLVEAVVNSFKCVDAYRDTFDNSHEIQAINDASVWIHKRFVRQYFIERADEFKSNPYYGG